MQSGDVSAQGVEQGVRLLPLFSIHWEVLDEAMAGLFTSYNRAQASGQSVHICEMSDKDLPGNAAGSATGHPVCFMS